MWWWRVTMKTPTSQHAEHYDLCLLTQQICLDDGSQREIAGHVPAQLLVSLSAKSAQPQGWPKPWRTDSCSSEGDHTKISDSSCKTDQLNTKNPLNLALHGKVNKEFTIKYILPTIYFSQTAVQSSTFLFEVSLKVSVVKRQKEDLKCTGSPNRSHSDTVLCVRVCVHVPG